MWYDGLWFGKPPGDAYLRNKTRSPGWEEEPLHPLHWLIFHGNGDSTPWR